MALLPELAVQSTFVSAGLHLGFVLYLQQATEYSVNVVHLISPASVGPLLVAVLAAGGTAALLYIVKMRTRQETFRQTSLLLAAVLCSLLSGIPYVFPDHLTLHVVAAYTMAVSHGIVFVAGLSFVNMRVSSRLRSTRLAVCHLCYLLGMSIAAQTLTQPCNWLVNYGYALIFSSGLSLVLLLVNEMFQFFKVYDYRVCLDPDLQRVNAEYVLLYDRKEIIDTLRANAARFPDMVMVVSEVKRRWKITVLLVLLHINAFMLMTPSLRDQFRSSIESNNGWVIHWISLAGLFVALLLLVFFSARMVYLLFGFLTIVCMLVSVFIPPVPSALVFAAPCFAFLGIIYPIADIAIADTSSFARTEILLAAGFALEKLLLVVFLMLSRFAPVALALDDPYDIASWRGHVIAFIVVGTVLLVLVAYLYSDTRGKSLYCIRKEMMGIRMEKRTAEDEQQLPDVLPPIQYPYNSATGTYAFPKKATPPISPLAMPVWNGTPFPPETVSSPTATTPGSLPVSPSTIRPSPLAMRALAPTSPNPVTRSVPANSAMRSTNSTSQPTVFFVGGTDNRYARDFQRMSPGNVMPRAIIGGAIFSSIAWSM